MKELLAELFDRYHQDVYTYLYSLCHDVSLAEDLTSEVFVEVVRSIAAFRGRSDIKTWMFSIAISGTSISAERNVRSQRRASTTCMILTSPGFSPLTCPARWSRPSTSFSPLNRS